MSSNGIPEVVRSFVVKKLPSAKRHSFNDDLPLLQSGIIDSLGVLELVTFLEQSFAIRFADDELTPDNFGSIKSIAAFVTEKKSKIELSA